MVSASLDYKGDGMGEKGEGMPQVGLRPGLLSKSIRRTMNSFEQGSNKFGVTFKGFSQMHYREWIEDIDVCR